MHLKKLVVIFPVLLVVPVLTTVAWATASSAPSNDTSAAEAKGLPAAEPMKKNEEQSVLCSAGILLKSDFIRTSVWPGIGPFDVVASKASDSADTNKDANKSVQLADPSHNQLSYTTNSNEISNCELELHNSIGEAQGLLNLQMGADFLLEGLGVKPGQIHIVNMSLSKESKLLTGNNYNPISVTIAPLTVSFQNLGTKEGTTNPLFRVVVVNQRKLAEKIALAEPASSEISAANNKTGEVNVANSPETNNSTAEAINTKKIGYGNAISPLIEPIESASSSTEKNQPQAANSDTIASSSMTTTVKNQATESGGIPNKTGISKPLNKDELLKKQFLDLIVNWQHIKKTAVRQQQTNELSQVLAGKALVRQSDAVKWLVNNHKYYEMLAQGATIEHFDALVPGKKYAVFAEVKEKTRFVDASTKQILKETDDTYKVRYTIEHIGQHWLITDSALIKQGAKKASNSGAKSTH